MPALRFCGMEELESFCVCLHVVGAVLDRVQRHHIRRAQCFGNGLHAARTLLHRSNADHPEHSGQCYRSNVLSLEGGANRESRRNGCNRAGRAREARPQLYACQLTPAAVLLDRKNEPCRSEQSAPKLKIPPIEVSATQDDHSARAECALQVREPGSGIPPLFRPHRFHPHSR